LAGGKHRCAKKGEFEKSEEACKNNEFFTKMVQIMKAAKVKHPHVVVAAIENPVGQLQQMPLMVSSHSCDWPAFIACAALTLLEFRLFRRTLRKFSVFIRLE
jgi:hypothetical protein